MTFKLILFGIIALIVLAIAAEAHFRKKRPLSRHSANDRRWDDKNSGAETQHIMHTSWRNSQTGETREHSWSISRNPHEQAKALMPDDATQTKDPK
ncbi:hypothetical protein [Halocynthiibacter namhaensis]|uniref:hypothetical protein n=1 Tax=Halocynthiibacter namhaensis TaxID=1290553 RepID=UPI0005791C60|nr:hypothetical protein [Halocynthiibacter namhaensis]